MQAHYDLASSEWVVGTEDSGSEIILRLDTISAEACDLAQPMSLEDSCGMDQRSEDSIDHRVCIDAP